MFGLLIPCWKVSASAALSYISLFSLFRRQEGTAYCDLVQSVGTLKDAIG